MTWGAVAIGGATLLTGVIGADKSAGAVENAANISADTSRYIYDRNVALNDPFYKQGLAALPYLQAYTGVPGLGSTITDARVKPILPVKPTPPPAALRNTGAFGTGGWEGDIPADTQTQDYTAALDKYNRDYEDYTKRLAEYNAATPTPGTPPVSPVGLPSYEDTVTKPMEAWQYEQSPAYKAKYTLGIEELNKQLQARGLAPSGVGATRAADLARNLTASDYNSERSYALGNKQDLYKSRYSENSDRYNRLLDQVKMATGASSAMGQAGNQYASQVGNSAMQAGEAQAGFYSGLGGLIPQSVNTGLKAWETGNKAGWWGGSDTAVTAAGANAASTAYRADMVPDYGTLYGL